MCTHICIALQTQVYLRSTGVRNSGRVQAQRERWHWNDRDCARCSTGSHPVPHSPTQSYGMHRSVYCSYHISSRRQSAIYFYIYVSLVLTDDVILNVYACITHTSLRHVTRMRQKIYTEVAELSDNPMVAHSRFPNSPYPWRHHSVTPNS